MFPDFSALSKTGEILTAQFDRLIELLQKISDDTAVIRASIEEKTDGQ